MMMPTRAYHIVGRPAASVVDEEAPVLVYDSNEFHGLNEATEARGRAFEDGISGSGHSSKVYSLLPFLIEARFTPKSFVLRMQLYPKAGLL